MLVSLLLLACGHVVHLLHIGLLLEPTHVLLREAALVSELVLLEASVVVHHLISASLHVTVHHRIHLVASPIIIEVLLHLLLLEPHVLLVTVLPLLGLHRQRQLFRRHGVFWLAQLGVSVGVVTLVTQGTIFVRFVVSASFGLVLLVNFLTIFGVLLVRRHVTLRVVEVVLNWSLLVVYHLGVHLPHRLPLHAVRHLHLHVHIHARHVEVALRVLIGRVHN